MQSITSNVTKGLPLGAIVETCDNSGAKEIKIIAAPCLLVDWAKAKAKGYKEQYWLAQGAYHPWL